MASMPETPLGDTQVRDREGSLRTAISRYRKEKTAHGGHGVHGARRKIAWCRLRIGAQQRFFLLDRITVGILHTSV